MHAAREIAREADVFVHPLRRLGKGFRLRAAGLGDPLRVRFEEERGRGQFLAEAVVQILADAAFLSLADEENLLLEPRPVFDLGLKADICLGHGSGALFDPTLQLLVREVKIGGIPRDLRETAQRAGLLIIQPVHRPIHPDAAAIFAQMPAAIGRAAVAERDLDFLFLPLDGAVFRSENYLAALSERFLGRPAEDSFRALVPINDDV